MEARALATSRPASSAVSGVQLLPVRLVLMISSGLMLGRVSLMWLNKLVRWSRRPHLTSS